MFNSLSCASVMTNKGLIRKNKSNVVLFCLPGTRRRPPTVVPRQCVPNPCRASPGWAAATTPTRARSPRAVTSDPLNSIVSLVFLVWCSWNTGYYESLMINGRWKIRAGEVIAHGRVAGQHGNNIRLIDRPAGAVNYLGQRRTDGGKTSLIVDFLKVIFTAIIRCQFYSSLVLYSH